MRIALLSRYSLPFHFQGGLQRYAYDVARHLARRGAEVVVYCEPPDPGLLAPAEAPAAHFVHHARLPLLGRAPGTVIVDRITNYFAFADAAARAILDDHRARPFDVIYAQGLGAWGVARRWSQVAEPKPLLAVINQGMEEFKNPDWRKWLLYSPFRAGIRRGTWVAGLVVVTDEAARVESRRLLGFEPRAWAVVPAGIDLEQLAALEDTVTRRRLSDRLDLDHRRPLLLSVARLEVNKGLAVALEALARVRERLPTGWQWAIVGQGSQRGALERQARAAGLADHVVFLDGASDAELHALYAIADLFLHPTLFEGTSLVTVEAMVHGLPIVASRAGGIPEKITGGRNGVLVAPGDAVALGDALVSVLARPDRGASLGAAARSDATSRFAWTAIVDHLLWAFERARDPALPPGAVLDK